MSTQSGRNVFPKDSMCLSALWSKFTMSKYMCVDSKRPEIMCPADATVMEQCKNFWIPIFVVMIGSQSIQYPLSWNLNTSTGTLRSDSLALPWYCSAALWSLNL